MAFKALTAAGAVIALLTASTAFAADQAPLPVSAKTALMISKMNRARTHVAADKSNQLVGAAPVVLVILGITAVGLGIAGAAGAFNSSN